MINTAHSIEQKNDEVFLKKISRSTFVVSIVLLIFKFYAYFLTNSQGIYSDALESIVNVAMGALTIFVIWYAALPADDDHPYGHGKIESLAASFEGGAIAIAGIMIIVDSIRNILVNSKELTRVDEGAFLIFAAGIVNGLYGLWILKKGRDLKSEALKANGIHLFSDMLTSIGVLLGLLFVKITGIVFLDTVVAIAIGSYLIFSGIKIFRESMNVLVDAQDRSLLEKLVALFEKHYRPGVIQLHFTRIIRSGRYHHIDCHMVIPEFWTIEKSHEFSDEFERVILSEYETAGEFHVHLDPCRKKYCTECELENCPIRVAPFERRRAFLMEELTRPTEQD
jgi:cation diffusion facilitator family transporter